MDHVPDLYDQGLQADLVTLVDRRRVLQLMGLAGVFTVAACAPGASTSASASALASAAAATAGTAACDPIPEETAGPFPGDGSNGPDVLEESGVVRSDIRSSVGSASGTAEGIPLTIRLLVQDESNACEPLAGAAVYLWHSDREGRYSMYSAGVENENYLRGVQQTDAEGLLEFTSIFPGCYQGRWPHIHFEVYPDVASTSDASRVIATSQIAFPRDTCEAAYATAGYERSVTNLASLSLETDNVFRDDGGVHQLGTMSGTITDGLVVELAVPVATA